MENNNLESNNSINYRIEEIDNLERQLAQRFREENVDFGISNWNILYFESLKDTDLSEKYENHCILQEVVNEFSYQKEFQYEDLPNLGIEEAYQHKSNWINKEFSKDVSNPKLINDAVFNTIKSTFKKYINEENLQMLVDENTEKSNEFYDLGKELNLIDKFKTLELDEQDIDKNTLLVVDLFDQLDQTLTQQKEEYKINKQLISRSLEVSKDLERGKEKC